MRRFKEIFIFGGGASPQIITETIYALSQKKPPVYPDEIFIIATGHGKKVIYKALIEDGILDSLIREYELPPVILKEENFVVPHDQYGQEIEDIRTEKDNEIIADLITSFIREKAKDESARLHGSLAGGRKTMSFYLGSAFQLFGRPWDKLYHVLVSPEFENNPHFYYKPKKNRIIVVRDREGKERRLKTKEAQIFLAELPFIRLSHRLNFQEKTFADLVAEGQREIDAAFFQQDLKINLSDRLIFIGNKPIAMQPMLLFIYVAFVHQKIKECLHPDRLYCCECRDCFKELNDLFDLESLKKLIGYYRDMYKGTPYKTEEFLKRWEKTKRLLPENVRQYISKIKKVLKEELPDESLRQFYTIQSLRIYGASRYGLTVDKSKIIIE